MEIFMLIVLAFTLIFQCLNLIFLLENVKNTKKMEKTQENTVEKPKKAELTEEQKQKQEKLREHFENLMGFDYEKALKSKGE